MFRRKPAEPRGGADASLMLTANLPAQVEQIIKDAEYWPWGGPDDDLGAFDALLKRIETAVSAGDSAGLQNAYHELIVLSEGARARRIPSQGEVPATAHKSYPRERVNELVHSLRAFAPQPPPTQTPRR